MLGVFIAFTFYIIFWVFFSHNFPFHFPTASPELVEWAGRRLFFMFL